MHRADIATNIPTDANAGPLAAIIMTTHEFELTASQLEEILLEHPNMGKNSHVGNAAVKIVRLYFKSIDQNVTFGNGKAGSDIEVRFTDRVEHFEIKGTADAKFTWTKIKVSSQPCHDALVEGMKIIRVTSVGTLNPKLYFLQYGEDFLLKLEARWTITRIRPYLQPTWVLCI